VLGVQSGREFIGTATVVRQNLKIGPNSPTKPACRPPWPGICKCQFQISAKRWNKLFGSNNIIVKVYSTGSNIPSPTSASEMLNYYSKFKNSTGEEQTAKLIVVPYQLVPDYPWENPLEGNSKEDYIGMMVVGLWELKAAIRDAGFVIDPTTVAFFALGTDQTLRNQRIAYIKTDEGRVAAGIRPASQGGPEVRSELHPAMQTIG